MFTDNKVERIAVVAVGLALGTYLSWVQHRWPAQVRRIGLAAAACGALVGASLEFQATMARSPSPPRSPEPSPARTSR